MLTTREIFNYTLRTSRDIFDDFEQLDCHFARASLGRDNEVSEYMSVILESLDKAGVVFDEVTEEWLNELLKPTVESIEDDDSDFIADPIAELHTRAMTRFPKCSVRETIKSFLLSNHLNDEVLLDAPYDVTLDIYNEAIKEHNKKMTKR